jgi:hypothetical protein
MTLSRKTQRGQEFQALLQLHVVDSHFTRLDTPHHLTQVGEVWLDENEFTECPQIVALLKTKGEISWPEQTTDAIEIHIQGNVNNMELKLPFARL